MGDRARYSSGESSGVPPISCMSNSGMSPVPNILTWFDTGAPMTVARKRSVWPTAHVLMKPPYEYPPMYSRSGSAMPLSTSLSTPARMSSKSRPPQSRTTASLKDSPYVVLPRGLGISTMYPAAASDWNSDPRSGAGVIAVRSAVHVDRERITSDLSPKSGGYRTKASISSPSGALYSTRSRRPVSTVFRSSSFA